MLTRAATLSRKGCAAVWASGDKSFAACRTPSGARRSSATCMRPIVVFRALVIGFESSAGHERPISLRTPNAGRRPVLRASVGVDCRRRGKEILFQVGERGHARILQVRQCRQIDAVAGGFLTASSCAEYFWPLSSARFRFCNSSARTTCSADFLRGSHPA